MRAVLVAMTLIVGWATECFGQAGSPDQAMFNRAVMRYHETLTRELAIVVAAVSSGSGKGDSNPIRTNLAGGDAARESAVALSSCAAAVQVRASQFGVEEWFGIITEIRDFGVEAAKQTDVVPARYSIDVIWSPISNPDLAAIKRESLKIRAERTRNIEEDDGRQLIRAQFWVDEGNRDLLKEAAAVNPGDCILFTVDASNDHALRLTRTRKLVDDPNDMEGKLLQAANLDRDQIFSMPPQSAEVQLGKQAFTLYAYPWKKTSAQTTSGRMWDGLHLKSIRVIDPATAAARDGAAKELASAIEQHVFADKAKGAIAAQRLADMTPWIDKLHDSPERLLQEARARVYEDLGDAARTRLTVEVATQAAGTVPESLKAEGLVSKGLAELRSGDILHSLATLQEVSKAKPTDDEALLANITQCLANLAKGDKEKAINGGRELVEKINAASTIIDYRVLAMLTEVQAVTGIETLTTKHASPNSAGIPKKATFFNIEAVGTRFAYIVDVSGSMEGSRMDELKEGLVKSINGLADSSSFMISVYSSDASALGNRKAWTSANDAGKKWGKGEILRLSASGATNPLNAFRMVYALKPLPDAIFFLTDGEIPPDQAEQVLVMNKEYKVVVHSACLESNEGEQVLKRIARESGGTYAFIPGVSVKGKP